MSSLPHLTDATFDRAVASATPVYVVLSAPSACGICQKQAPALTDAWHIGVPLHVVDVERPDSKAIAARFERSWPNHLVFSHGNLIKSYLGGPLTKEQILALYQAAYAQANPQAASVFQRAIGTFGR